MKFFNRRNFIKTGSVATAGMITSKVYGNTNQDQTKSPVIITNKYPPIYRTLGDTGIKLPIVSVGKLPIDNINLVKAIFRSNVVHIDSADGYHDGKNDEMIGTMLKEFDRDNYVLSTKIHLPQDKETGLYKDEATTEMFLETLDESLNRQGVDYVDILYLHMPRSAEAALDERMIKALKIAKEKGKAKHVGVSTHSKMADIIEAAINSDFYEVVLTTYNYQLKNDDVKNAIAKAAKKGIGVIAMKTQAGKYLDKERTKPVNSSAAVKWALQDENVCTSLVSVRSYEDLETYTHVMKDITLSKTEKQDLQANLSLQESIFCEGCEECIENCPYNLPIPDMMRAYMYTYGYKDIKMGYETLNSLELPHDICDNCDECIIDCKKDFDIKAKIKDVVRLKNVPSDFIA